MDNKIKNALRIAWQYGQIKGEEHKMWVIDQMVRVLCGSKEEYLNFVKAYEAVLTDEEYYMWHQGVPKI